MRKQILFTIVVIFLYQLDGWGQSEHREVDHFTGISMGVPGDLFITQGNRISVDVEGDRDDLEDLVTEVRNGKLEIRYERSGWNFSRDRVTIRVTLPEIDEISLGGSGKVMSENTLESDNLELNVSGSGKMELKLSADDLETSISGSGNVSLEGSADHVHLTISGSGSLDAEDLETDSYVVQISGSGRSRINVGDALEARISGSGSVYYKGDPDKVISNVSGSGRVKKL